MRTVKKLLKFLFPKLYNRLIVNKIEKRFRNCKDLKQTIKKDYKAAFNVDLNLDNPVTFYEKVNYLKMYQNDYSFSNFVDKVSAKELAKSFSKEIIVSKLICTFDTFKAFSSSFRKKELPPVFVAKLNHTSGDVYFFNNGIWRDKKGHNISQRIVFANLKAMIDLNYYHTSFEKCYDQIKRRILIEEYLPSVKGLDEYKVFCNYGEPKMVNVVYGRQDGDGVKEVFTDDKLKILPVNQGLKLIESGKVYKPKCWESMIEFAKKASAGKPMLRVDMLTDGNNFYFCEFTFYDFAGMSIFYPLEWNSIIGDKFDLRDFEKIPTIN